MKYKDQVKMIKKHIAEGSAIKIESSNGVWILDENPTEAEMQVFFAQLKILKRSDASYTVASGNRKDEDTETPTNADKIKATEALMSMLGINLEKEIEDALSDEVDEKLDSRTDKEFILDKITEDLKANNYKLSPVTISTVLEMSNVAYRQLTPSMRVCVIQLPTGHEVIGVAQVLNSENDVESIGNNVAYKNAVEEVWKAIGGVAKAIMKD